MAEDLETHRQPRCKLFGSRSFPPAPMSVPGARSHTVVIATLKLFRTRRCPVRDVHGKHTKARHKCQTNRSSAGRDEVSGHASSGEVGSRALPRAMKMVSATKSAPRGKDYAQCVDVEALAAWDRERRSSGSGEEGDHGKELHRGESWGSHGLLRVSSALYTSTCCMVVVERVGTWS